MKIPLIIEVKLTGRFVLKAISFFSALFHSLIQMALNSVSDNTKQEALGYYGEVVDLIDKKAQVEHTAIYLTLF